MKSLGIIIGLLISFLPLKAQVNSLLKKATVALEHGDIHGACLLYQQILQQEANNVQALIGLGDCSLMLNDTLTAIKAYKQAIEVGGQRFEPYKALGKFYLEEGLINQAKQVFAKAIELFPNNWQAMLWYGTVQLYLGNYQMAKEMFDRALSLNNSYQVYEHIARSFASIDMFDSAIYYINLALAKWPNQDTLYFARSRINLQAEDLQAALTDIDSAIALKPNNQTYYLEKLSMLIYAQRYPQAIQFGLNNLKKVVDSNFYSFIGLAMYENHSPADSLKSVMLQCLSLQPAAALFYLAGLAYEMEKNYDSALYYFQKAVERDPWNIRFYKEKVLVQLLANTQDLRQDLLFQTFRPNNLKIIKKLIRKDDRYSPQKILSLLRQDPLSLGIDQYLCLYIAQALQKDYSPRWRKQQYIAVKNALDSGQTQRAITLAQKFLDQDPTNIGLYYLLSMAYLLQSDIDNFQQTYIPLIGFSFGIIYSGGGQSIEKAMFSAAESDELIVLKFIGYDQLLQRQLHQIGKKLLRQYTVAANGQVIDYFFDLELYKKHVNPTD